jgi:sugar lactone lactonase YvrE
MSASARILDRFPKSDRSDSIRICNWLGNPLIAIRSPEGLCPANVAYGGPDRRTLYITEAYSATILRARVDAPGQPMFSHA